MDDHLAISRLKQGDVNSLKHLVERYQARAVHAAYLILYDRQTAEDVVQSAFIKVAERIHQFDEGRPFAPWFFRIIVNDALKLAKKEQRRVSLDERLEAPAATLAEWLTNPELKPEQELAHKETRQIILRAIQSLPPGQRAVIVMRYYLDMSMKEMSARTGRPMSTIKWWLRDARKRLRDLLDTPQGG